MERTDLSELEAFVTVAQTGSFTKAAEMLESSKSNVGKAVQRLEARLGTRLFQRTTRAVHLTEDGETYLAASQAAIEGLREAEQALAARRSEPIGRVRIDLPSGFGRLLLPTFADLRSKYPKVTLEVALTDRFAEVVAEGWDIVVRIGDLPVDSEMTVRKLCDLRLGLYAAPAGAGTEPVPCHGSRGWTGAGGGVDPWAGHQPDPGSRRRAARASGSADSPATVL